jgi:uncharacterized metal-binding protein
MLMPRLPVYSLLVNRLQFSREASIHAHHQSVSSTRAMVCELLAAKILRQIDEDSPGRKGLLLLANILVAGFDPFQGAPRDIVEAQSSAAHWAIQKRSGYEAKSTALEVAIISESKQFLMSTAAQKVVNAIYTGQIIYTPISFIDIIPDHYKHQPISLYNPRKSPLLNQYRLIVPRVRNTLEVCQFVVLLVLYILVFANGESGGFSNFSMSAYEIAFDVYAFGWVLDQFASILEHGWMVYTQNLWSFLDVTFSVIYGAYIICRLHGFAANDVEWAQLAMKILSIGAPFLIPRLAFNLMSENLLFVCLRAMMANFTVLTMLAGWCFGGFLLSMQWLGQGQHTSVTIAKWMLYVWFGLDGIGIQRSVEFHWLLGPVLMVTFAFLGNTLFLTITVSMLSSTFSNIANNADAEIQFRRAVLTFEGVKSDAIFAYQPPFNILALFVLLPLKFVLSPRWFHKINVTTVRFLNAPILLLIRQIDKSAPWMTPKKTIRDLVHKPNKFAFWNFPKFSVHHDCQAVFNVDPPPSTLEGCPHARIDRALSTSSVFSTNKEDEPDDHKGSRPKHSKDIDGLVGIVHHLPDLVHRTHATTSERLEALEESTKKIERLLQRLYEVSATLQDSDGNSD